MLFAGGLIAMLFAGFALSDLLASDEIEDDDDLPESEPEDQAATLRGLSDLLSEDPPGQEMTGTDSDDRLVGGAGDDIISGEGGHDDLSGMEGADTLDGGHGDDILRMDAQDTGIGGEGADDFVIDPGDPEDDTIAGIADFVPGVDQLILEFEDDGSPTPEITFDEDSQPGSTIVLADGVPTAFLDGVTGLEESDVVVSLSDGEDWDGTPEEDEDGPYEGESLLDGGTPDDALRGRAGMSQTLGPATHDALVGDIGDDAISDTDSGGALFGNEGDDTLSGNGGNDELHGDEGDDSLDGGAGHDFIDGGEGADDARGGDGSDLIFGGDGDDTLSGDDGDDFLQGGFGADELRGGDGDDTLDGTFAAGGASFGPFDQDQGDTLDGGAGDDTILAGAGDVVTGGEGADTFISGSHIEQTDPAAHILDYDQDEDLIELLYDPDQSPDPQVIVEHHEEGGASVLLDGNVVLTLSDATGLDASQIVLKPTPLGGAA